MATSSGVKSPFPLTHPPAPPPAPAPCAPQATAAHRCQAGGRQSEELRLGITGMTCSSCSGAVEAMLRARSGITHAAVGILSHTAEVSYIPGLVAPRDIVASIRALGYAVEVLPSKDLAAGQALRDREKRFWWRKFVVSACFALPLVLLAMVLAYVPATRRGLEMRFSGFTLNDLLQWALCTPVQFGVGWSFHLGALRALRRRAANMDVLVSLGTNTAYAGSLVQMFHARALALGSDGSTEQGQPPAMGPGFFETSALLITFITLGKFLEVHAKGRANEAVAMLMRLAPPHAILCRLGEGGPCSVAAEEHVPVALLQPGDVLKVLPGALVPADGEVLWGHSHVDESAVSGEAHPVKKGPGSLLVSGTLNCGAALLMKARAVGSDTALASIIRVVEQAQMSRAPHQAIADRISAAFVPSIVLLSVLTFLGWLVAGLRGAFPADWLPHGSTPFLFALLFGVAVIVVACPCAVGLAAPTAFVVGADVAAKMGILIKGAEALERASRLRAVVGDFV